MIIFVNLMHDVATNNAGGGVSVKYNFLRNETKIQLCNLYQLQRSHLLQACTCIQLNSDFCISNFATTTKKS